MESNELARLEQFVDKLLHNYNELKEKHQKLEAAYREKESECEELRRNLADAHNERTEVGERVTGLINRIEQWEFTEEFGPEAGEENNAGTARREEAGEAGAEGMESESHEGEMSQYPPGTTGQYPE